MFHMHACESAPSYARVHNVLVDAHSKRMMMMHEFYPLLLLFWVLFQWIFFFLLQYLILIILYVWECISETIFRPFVWVCAGRERCWWMAVKIIMNGSHAIDIRARCCASVRVVIFGMNGLWATYQFLMALNAMFCCCVSVRGGKWMDESDGDVCVCYYDIRISTHFGRRTLIFFLFGWSTMWILRRKCRIKEKIACDATLAGCRTAMSISNTNQKLEFRCWNHVTVVARRSICKHKKITLRLLFDGNPIQGWHKRRQTLPITI